MKKSINPFVSTDLGNLTMRNHFIRSGCYEGFCRKGFVTDELIEHHRRVAEGGVAATTLAYGCVSPDGRTFADQIVIGEESAPGLSKLADAVHGEGAAISIQLTHGGYFSDPKVLGRKPLGASAVFNNFRMTKPEVLDDAGIERILGAFSAAAQRVRDAGFDMIEIHAGHGYLLSQFLSPYTNRREDGWGGSQEKRNRFPAAVVRRIREVVGTGFPILVKMNVTDGIRGGLEIEGAISAARAFEEAGASALIPSCGSTSMTPFMMLRGKVPVREMSRVRPTAGERIATRLFGRLMVQEFPFEPLFLHEPSLRISEEVSIPVVYVGGVVKGSDVQRLMDEGFLFVQVGRATIRNPDFVKDLESGKMSESDCDACNRCVAAMDGGGVLCVTAEEEASINSRNRS